jgi:outer membrane immunogenic protein
MKRVAITAIAAICTIAFTQIASAADMPAKAPIIAPVAPVSWTGFYVGGNVGYSWGKADTDQNTNATIVSFPGGVFSTITSPLAPFAHSSSPRLDGFIVGAQAGYNWQFNPRWVLGFETDI